MILDYLWVILLQERLGLMRSNKSREMLLKRKLEKCDSKLRENNPPIKLYAIKGKLLWALAGFGIQKYWWEEAAESYETFFEGGGVFPGAKLGRALAYAIPLQESKTLIRREQFFHMYELFQSACEERAFRGDALLNAAECVVEFSRFLPPYLAVPILEEMRVRCNKYTFGIAHRRWSEVVRLSLIVEQASRVSGNKKPLLDEAWSRFKYLGAPDLNNPTAPPVNQAGYEECEPLSVARLAHLNAVNLHVLKSQVADFEADVSKAKELRRQLIASAEILLERFPESSGLANNLLYELSMRILVENRDFSGDEQQNIDALVQVVMQEKRPSCRFGDTLVALKQADFAMLVFNKSFAENTFGPAELFTSDRAKLLLGGREDYNNLLLKVRKRLGEDFDVLHET